MNIALYNLRNTTIVINNLLKNGSICQLTRGIKSDLKIKWIRPPKIPSILPQKSGDGGINHKIQVNDLPVIYKQSQELQNVDETVKKIFTLEFLPFRETVQNNRSLTINLVKQHDFDDESVEVALASMTNQILNLQDYFNKHPRNKRAKHFLKELIDKRKKLLSKLRKWDYKRFEWILEKLNLTYKPHIEYTRIERKASLRKLTAIHCDKVKQDKLDAYKKELEREQERFFKEKAEALAFIRCEEIACGITPTVTEEEIVAAQKKAAQYI